MGSMNWLGFSLSPQELAPSSNPHHNQDDHQTRLGYNSGDCFDLTSDHSSAAAASQLPPTPFGILEAFNRNNHIHQSQDWNMKGLEANDNYKTSSSSSSSDHIHLSMLMNNNNNNNNNSNNNNNQQPKLENFLGRHSFADHHHHHHASAAAEYMYPTNCTTSLHIPSSIDSPNININDSNNISINNNNNNSNNNGSSIGLSMIKTWLRNQPANLPETAKNDAVVAASTISGGGGSNTAATTQSALSLSMGSTGLQVETSSSSDVTKQQTPRAAVDSQTSGSIDAVPRKSIDTFGQRTSIYRGVTRHRWTGRYEAHLWDNSCRREGQTRKGRQVYLGGYDKEEKAARAYDLAALKYWGTTTTTNFPISNYEKEVEEMKHMTRQEYVASLRRKSSGFSRGASIYRGVTRHHQHGRWQARIGRVAGNKDLYLGTFSTQEEAAEAYDIAAIKFRGLNAVTNFDMTRYDVKSILESATLPIGGAAKRLKDAEAAAAVAADITVAAADDSTIAEALGASHYATWPAPPPHFALHYPNNYGSAPRVWCKQEVQDSSDIHHHNNNNSHGFAYHDLQMNNNNNNNNNNVSNINTHNFFQSNSVLHNLMGIDHHHHHSNNNSYSTCSTGNDYVNIPMATTTVISTPDHQGSSTTTFGSSNENDHGVFGASSADVAYHRSLYNYMSQQHSQQYPGGGAVVKASSGGGGGGGGGGGSYDSWVPTAVPAIVVPRSNTVALCHGAPPFTVWNDA